MWMLPWTGTTGACAGGLQVDGLMLMYDLSQRHDGGSPRAHQGQWRLGLAPLTHAQGGC